MLAGECVGGVRVCTGEVYLHLGGDELLQDKFPPHTCWQNDPSIAAWMNASFAPAGRDPRGFGGAVAYFKYPVRRPAVIV